ncbi:B3 domain-containing protein Os06g0194400-like [Triticum dicoccoides]|uniref:B3 domain-containing protein Os06g0194400-like n=1 Tax=Triticum dicoccoides TaxID=85692 RepID=UPI00189141C9|nr:B3 domain-containing protein Os06g0194400-like [Triticum dicoccoides]
MAGAIAYEEQRRRQVEENQRKLEELKLRHLSAAVREAATPKPSPAKSVKRKRVPREGGEDTPIRRSGRVASLPEQPKYRFEDVFHVLEKKIRRGRRTTTSTRSDLINRVYATDKAREYATTMADELQAKLGSGYPSFVKPMTQSHVTGGFWLGLPLPFCRKHLPKRDERLTLKDEQGVESETLYLALKNGLSAGWRGFAIQHNLVDGDCLVFELINQTTFKVYIIRQSSYYER